MKGELADSEQEYQKLPGKSEGREQFCIMDATTLRYLKEVSDNLDDQTLTFGPKELALRYDSQQKAKLWLKVILTFFPLGSIAVSTYQRRHLHEDVNTWPSQAVSNK